MQDAGSFRYRLVQYVAFSWGLCAYFPIGVMYLNVLLMLIALAVFPDLTAALARLRRHVVVLPLTLFVAWTFVAALAGDWYPDTSTRLFHTFRVALVLCMGMMMGPGQARAAFAGFLAGSVVAAMIVALHHAWGLPNWALWSSLLVTRNNFSSGNMITMATAYGACLCVALGHAVDRQSRWLLLALALGLGSIVAMHAVSRNAQLLLAGLTLVALLYRFRNTRAVLGGLAAMALLVATTWHFSPTTSERFVEMAENLHAITADQNYSTSVGVRWRMYQEAVNGMLDQPVLGTGPGSWLPRWRVVWQQLGPSQPPELHAFFAEINNPHNDFLLTGMETGVPGMLLLAWLMARIIRVGWRDGTTLGGITVVLGVSIVMTAMVNAPFRDAAMGMTLLWLLGAGMALQRGPAHA
nr:putative O-antigen ligase family protein [uncultured bacterium]